MKNTLLILLFLYLVIRFAATSWLESHGRYSSYIFEVILVAIAIGLTRNEFVAHLRVSKKIAAISLLALPFGFAAFKASSPLGILIPFDFSQTETIVFLLLVAPVLEELVFRYFAWGPVGERSPAIALFFTSALFAYSHFHSYFFVPEQFHAFIYYQTAYTFLLALACGFAVFKYRSLTGAILIHFFFNFGFYLGAVS